MRPRTKQSSQGKHIVGYKRPPEKNQFQKGVSGNPSGRPRRAPSFSDRIRKELLSRQTVNVGGQRLSLTTEEVLIKSFIQHAIRGKNTRAMEVVLEWILDLQGLVEKDKRAKQISYSKLTREAIEKMTPQERIELYRSSLSEINREAFDSGT